jgi:hypothetical protein
MSLLNEALGTGDTWRLMRNADERDATHNKHHGLALDYTDIYVLQRGLNGCASRRRYIQWNCCFPRNEK